MGFTAATRYGSQTIADAVIGVAELFQGHGSLIGKKPGGAGDLTSGIIAVTPESAILVSAYFPPAELGFHSPVASLPNHTGTTSPSASANFF
jgi:hypothetical protein